MPSRLVHPKMMQMIQRDFLPQSCALMKPVKTRSTTGKENISHEAVPGYEAIPCRVSPAGGGERRGANFTYLDTTHTIALPGAFDDVTEEWIAVVDGQEYQILRPGRASRDSEGVMTSLETRFVR